MARIVKINGDEYEITGNGKGTIGDLGELVVIEEGGVPVLYQADGWMVERQPPEPYGWFRLNLDDYIEQPSLRRGPIQEISKFLTYGAFAVKKSN